MLIAKSVLGSRGATRTDEFVAEVKRKVNEDGNKSYAKLAVREERREALDGPGGEWRPYVFQ
ncbi:Hypothetical protein FKW44_016354 [Caligus rogercresseyi]|uniref:Uncharacterized protein n=1 Tax=Caligus rogercresseyi TaxID=217165 RepID=A0A7T8H1R5_CALRO|nr:Hypothetical protein FKW44_016354 [Caligus rogercresseyi]